MVGGFFNNNMKNGNRRLRLRVNKGRMRFITAEKTKDPSYQANNSIFTENQQYFTK